MAWEGKERRSAPRARCVLPIELSSEGASFSTHAETTDVALCGCYVANRFPLSIGTKLSGELSISSRRIKVLCEIITMDPGVGNGIRFHNMSDDDKAALKAFLESTGKSESEAQSDSGFIIR
ncbi:MAG TPA: PilZ domain-containing protein [Terriglobales bacterium]|nr:PilZ domain-containing protein [Terriglobales bacterium]